MKKTCFVFQITEFGQSRVVKTIGKACVWVCFLVNNNKIHTFKCFDYLKLSQWCKLQEKQVVAWHFFVFPCSSVSRNFASWQPASYPDIRLASWIAKPGWPGAKALLFWVLSIIDFLRDFMNVLQGFWISQVFNWVQQNFHWFPQGFHWFPEAFLWFLRISLVSSMLSLASLGFHEIPQGFPVLRISVLPSRSSVISLGISMTSFLKQFIDFWWNSRISLMISLIPLTCSLQS